MNWIKENTFVAALAGITLIGAIILFIVGSRGAARYNEANAAFNASAEEVAAFERLPLYPKDENRDGKRKALIDYRNEVEALRDAFNPYRPESLENLSPQAFNDRLLASRAEVGSALEEAGATLPDGFFMGFEPYTTSLPREGATGIMNYQLSAIKDLMLSLASSSPSALLNLHRPRLPEEDGTSFEPADEAVARELPVEIIFKGTEQAARDFVTSVVSLENHFFVIRSLRVINEKREPPRSADAELVAPAAAVEPEAADPFAGAGFVFPDEDEPAADGDAGAAEEPAADAPAAPAEPADSSRILGQVLGNEEVIVFLRIDILQFLPAKELVQVQN